MKYNLLLKLLRVLMYVKRFFWWLGKGVYFVLAKIFSPIYAFFAYLSYKINYFFKKIGLADNDGWLLKRSLLQAVIFIVLFFVAFPQTKLYTQKSNYLPGQKTIAFALFGTEEEYTLEEVTASNNQVSVQETPVWKVGTVGSENGMGQNTNIYSAPTPQEYANVVAGGLALGKPIIQPGISSGGVRNQLSEYIIKQGDSLGNIAYRFDVSVATILWENNITLKSTLRLGDKLVIPPTTGIMHKIKKGDNIGKIAILYDAKEADIIKFNNLKSDGSDLKIGERIMVPGGVKPAEKAIARAKPVYTQQTTQAVVRPPSSSKAPGANGFVWPSGAHAITQYFGWSHHGLDIAGPFQTPNYAAKAGTVEFAQCGWNRGYGCYVQIDHGNGVKTLYGHHSKLLVSPGDYVEAGQVIGLMGNTGNVRGRTGIHLHFEVIVNGVRVNPLGYVR